MRRKRNVPKKKSSSTKVTPTVRTSNRAGGCSNRVVRLDPVNLQVDYLPELFTPRSFKATVKWIVDEIKKIEAARSIRIESVAVRGVSGTAIGFAVAARLGCGVTLVRKIDFSHSRYRVEGITHPKHYVIIDDFADTGNTIRAIINDMPRKPVAVLLYRSVEDRLPASISVHTVIHRYPTVAAREKVKEKILYGR